MNIFYTLEKNRRETRIKQYSIILLITILISGIPDIMVGNTNSVYVVFAFSPVLIFCIYIRKKYTDLAGSFLLLYTTFTILVGNIYYGNGSGNYYFYIAEYIALLLIIDTRKKVFLIANNLHIGLSIIITQFCNWNDYIIVPLSEKSLAFMGNINVLLSILVSLYLFYSYIEENITKENYLISMHNRIIKKNKIIENAQTNLETFIYRSSHNLQGPIRSIMGLYNLSILENNPEKLKELIQLTNESAQQLDKELSITSQVFKINQHLITLSPVNLYQFVVDFFKRSDIELNVSDISKYNSKADVEMLTIGMENLNQIFEKLRLNASVVPHLKIDIIDDVFVFTFSFEAKFMDKKYIPVFFSPYQKDLGFLYNLSSEPYICRRIMDKLHGDISLSKISDSTLAFFVSSKLI
ncbi:MAG: histidine kinase [Cytophaga sp.]|uniref:histidine kinase n=1 Tax=Cytophaga sp. TaxID=29535 RepID=UPI003F7FB831